jgi:CubicO group peptidase (beta-lactamase class C family)
MIRARIAMFVLIAAAVAPVRADHESVETILGQFKRISERGGHVLQPAKVVRPLPASTDKATVDRIGNDARSFLRETMSVVILQNGELVFEGYANGATAESPLNSYSMAKSMTALAVGEALCAGKLKSLDDKAVAYAPAIDGTAYGAASLRNLLRYTSGAQDPGGNGYVGIHSIEDFRAMWSHKLSIADLIRKYGQQSRWQQGEKFIYNGLDSQTLGLAVRGATGVPLQRWFEETVWQKAGSEHRAGWWVDRDGNGIAEIGVYVTTRDYARIGLYVLERLAGKTDDPCMTEFVREAAKPQVRKGYWDSAPAFGLGLHVGADGNTWILGHGGQRVGINVRTSRVFATNGAKQWQSFDRDAQALLAR